MCNNKVICIPINNAHKVYHHSLYLFRWTRIPYLGLAVERGGASYLIQVMMKMRTLLVAYPIFLRENQLRVYIRVQVEDLLET